MGSNAYILIIWLIISIFSVHIGHTGHYITRFDDSVRHDFHHFEMKHNYGPIGICDWLYKTEFKNKTDKK